MTDSETWHLRLPADLPTGRYNLYTGLYPAGGQQRVPAETAEGIPFPDARIPLDSLLVEASGASLSGDKLAFNQGDASKSINSE